MRTFDDPEKQADYWESYLVASRAVVMAKLARRQLTRAEEEWGRQGPQYRSAKLTDQAARAELRRITAAKPEYFVTYERRGEK